MRAFSPAFFIATTLAASAAAEPTGSRSGARTPTVFVHLESDRDVMLEREQNGTWRGVCMGSCDGQVPVGVKLRVTGSQPFVLRGVAGEGVTLHVRSAPHATVAAGAIAIGLGSASVTAAPFAYFMTACIFCGGKDDSGPSAAAIALGAGGLALIFLGAVLIAIETVTHVDGPGVVPAPELRAPKEAQLPTVTYPHDEGRSLAPTLPVLRVTF